MDDSSDSDRDELTAYLRDKAAKTLSKKDSPLQYWLSKRLQWPHLTALALHVYSAAVMSNEPSESSVSMAQR